MSAGSTRFIDLKELVKVNYNFIKLYKHVLKDGVYHLKNFKIMHDPDTLVLTAYLDCIEGYFKTSSKPIIYDLLGDLGYLLREAFIKYKIDCVRVEFLFHNPKKSGIFGLYFNYKEMSIPKPEKTTLEKIPLDDTEIQKEIKDIPVQQPYINNTLTADTQVTLPEQGKIVRTEEELRKRFDELMEKYNKSTDDNEKVQINNEMTAICNEINDLYSDN